MSIFSKIFGKKQTSETDETVRVGGMEDFMTLIRVYYQSVMAAQLGISNIIFPVCLSHNVMDSFFCHATQHFLKHSRHTEFPLHQVAYYHHQILAETLEHEEVILDIICIFTVLLDRIVNFFKEYVIQSIDIT